MKFARLSPRAMLALLSLICGLLGFGLMVRGLWLVYPPAALVVAGVALLGYAWRVDRAVSRYVSPGGKRED